MTSSESLPLVSLALRVPLADNGTLAVVLTSALVWPDRFDLFYVLTGEVPPGSAGPRVNAEWSAVGGEGTEYRLMGSGLSGGGRQRFGRLHFVPALPPHTRYLRVSVVHPLWQLRGTASFELPP